MGWLDKNGGHLVREPPLDGMFPTLVLGLQLSYQLATSSSLCTSHRSRALAGRTGTSLRRAVDRAHALSAARESFIQDSLSRATTSAHGI